MSKSITILLCILLIFFSSTPSFSQSHTPADKYRDRAQELQKTREYLKAARMYVKAIEIEEKAPNPDLSRLASTLNEAGYCYDLAGRYDQAIKYYQEALAIDKKLGREEDVAARLNSIGLVYNARGEYDQAIRYYEEALAIDKRLKSKRVAIRLNNIGMVYKDRGQYDQAIKYFEEALALDKSLGRERGVATILNNMGLVYSAWGQYDRAIKHYEEALAIDKRLGRDNIAMRLNNIGMVYKDWGQYDRAIKYFEEALAIDKRLGRERGVAIILNNIGLVYSAWGQYDQAVKYYQEALVIDKRRGSEDGIAIRLNNIGMAYHDWDQYEQAIEYFEKALALERKMRRQGGVAIVLSNMGLVYSALGRNDQALKYYQEALAIDKRLGREGDVAIRLNNIGMIYSDRKRHRKAIKYLKESLAIDQRLGKQAGVATTLNNIGSQYKRLKKYDTAIEYFKASIELKEKLRRTAVGDVRRDYLASQIHTYQHLIATYIQKKDIPDAFETIELSRAKSLAEKIAGSESALKIPSVQQVQSELPEDTAVLVYANVDPVNRFDTVQIVITGNQVDGIKRSDKKLIALARKQYQAPVKTWQQNRRGIGVVKKDQAQKTGPDQAKIDFDDVINYYRGLLTQPSSSYNRGIQKVGKKQFSPPNQDPGLERLLYDFLIKPLEKHIQGKKKLIIVPDGILGFLPFETLADENGRYLIATYDISYAHSMGILELIKKRKYQADREPMLAFGGAVYDEIKYAVDMIQSEKQLTALENNVYASFEEQRSVRDAYASLDMANWSNLPGTLSEVNHIAGVVDNAKIFTGDKVTENTIKELSASGDLTRYKVIHFATHGLVVPAVPELSAIVLSQFKNEQNGEDGYLRMQEIAELSLNADFVNLSACETGLGKIYGGEGVVGLTQSFLIAGANGVSVSLWQVADESTSRFMVAMYDLVKQRGVGYDEAMAEIKRRFIRGDFGDTYKAPYYWAPFVYYGKWN